MTGTIILSLVAVRQSDNNQSEMISQLLFGELAEIVEERGNWFYIRNHSDNIKGWIDKKSIKILNDEEFELIRQSPTVRVSVPLSFCRKTTNRETIFLAGGSILSAINDSECIVADENYIVNTTDINLSNETSGEYIVFLASQYLNSPYLWGGKSLLGIDCSGLVQVIFSICGIQMPRKASEQVEVGEVVDFLSEASAGDLAFFEDESGSIAKVGIMMDSQRIIHSSGWVKIDQLDSNGIITERNGNSPHKLRVIKRIVTA